MADTPSGSAPESGVPVPVRCSELRSLSLSSLALAAALSACGEAEIRSYRVPKEAPPAVAADVNPELPKPGGAPVSWSVPAGWKAVESTQSMRLATFDADGAEVTVSAFPGAAGGALANVNRWRGQIGLDPVDEAGLAQLLATSRSGATEVALLSMEGKDGKVMLGAILSPGDGQTWFVKSTTDAARAQAIRPAFEAFARSFTMGAAAPAAAAAASGGDGIDERLARFKPPEGWSTQAQGGGGIVAASFTGSAGARITATRLANDGGGDLANINRWRGQLGLQPLADLAAVERSDLVPGLLAVDLRDAKESDRMITVIAPSGGATWFFKLRGTVEAVESERAAFAAFVREVAGAGGAR